MGFKRLFTFFAIFILVFSTLLNPALAIQEKELSERTAEDYAVEKQSVTHVSDDVLDEVAESYKDAESFSIMAGSFSYSGVNVSGYVTRPDMITPVAGATVILGTPRFTGTPPANYCTLSLSNQTSTVTDMFGYFILGSSMQITSGGSTCDLNIIMLNDGYVANFTNVTINNLTQNYTDTNRTVQMHANLTAAISTDLPNEPYTNYEQNYNAIVNVTNLGDVAAENVTVNLTATNSTLTLPTMVNIGTINGLSSGTQSFAVKAPVNTTTDLLETGVNATDANDGSVKTAFANLVIYTQQQAGGYDAELEVSVATNVTWPTMLNATDELMEVNITAWNDGDATANDTVPAFYILKDSNGLDYTSNFAIAGPDPASANITGWTNQSFLYNISTHTATSGNYTIYAYANATDGNDLSSVNSNIAAATFYVNYFAPQITITSPAEGSFTGPSAFLNATTDYNAVCRFGNETGPTTNMTTTGTTSHSDYLTWLTNGTQTYYVNCIDAWNHENETSVTWYVDALGPEIMLNSPNSTLIKSGTTLNFTLTDMSNVSAGIWDNSTGNTTVAFTGTSATEYLTIDTTSWTGNVTLYVWANDTWGNVNNNITGFGTGGINFTIDDIAPNVTINEPANMSWHKDSVYVNATVTDDYGVSAVLARWENSTDTGNWTALSNVAGIDYFTGTVNTSAIADGNYTIRINATDLAGNFNDTETVTVQIDKTPPTVIITRPPTNDNQSSGSIRYINATVIDTGAGIASYANCTVSLPGKLIGKVPYNSSTNTCEGNLKITYANLGTRNLTVSIKDIFDNEGNDSVPIIITEAITGGGGGGGGGGGPGLNETPLKLDLDFTIDPVEAELLSNETFTFNVDIQNTGEDVLNNIVVITYALAQGDYYTDPKGITLFPNQNGTLQLIITPNSLGTGTYVIDLEIGNDRYSEGGKITLKITNASEAQTKESATRICDAAEAYIISFEAQGVEPSKLTDTKDDLDYARTKIDEGNYATAADICNSILNIPIEEINGTKPRNPITGFFFDTFGPFVAGNLFWILIAAGIVLGTYLGRDKISGWLAGFKKKGKNGKGGATNVKPAVKEAPKVAPKPEAPKAAAPKPEAKEPPKKDEPAWKIEWR